MKSLLQILPEFRRGLGGISHCSYIRGVAMGFSSSRPSTLGSFVEVQSPEEEVIIAMGSNVGDRIQNFNKALSLMKKSGIKITRHACLYETEPAYVTDQPLFLNSAIRGLTKLGPRDLLHALKTIEKDLGRTEGIRYGPRPIDLDILFYGKIRVDSDILKIPHERIWERPFVVAPLTDLLGSTESNEIVNSWHSFCVEKGGIFEAWEKLGGEGSIGREGGPRRVIPIGRNCLWDWSKKTQIMGVLNITPDSFSDGGKFISAKNAVSQVQKMALDGADIIDIGPQSTRPMASKVSPEEELDRLIPVIEEVTKLPEIEGKILSVDTFYSEVAMEAVKKGVHIVNDVSGGQLDPKMLPLVAELGVPCILMHMRGDPITMQNDSNTFYNDVCKEVAVELGSRVEEAESCGIPMWRIIVDPGIGFSKRDEHNMEILMGLKDFSKELSCQSLASSRVPLLVGPSRKGFLGRICEHKNALEREAATIAAVTTGILGGANIVRVHNVQDNLDAAKVCDAFLRLRKPKVS
ncbi:folate synthesis bifunctional protein, mitochondrial isoform X1 [Amborella trichopoda]|nr:folate synthesis bifunctional protein, mitochondrial isoform X1 [Amborella trichopoda]XP_011627819.1 folate synthesis bifunctional protein, mitochondrial isoform X1 [Amborella trichopoda]XP_020530483.1 folate synthesis bifunctional protein, mitochondrial isoform X1 [Amborella trichopoda]XP_020530484.1 folate synthesis bifunctional protein, mitochondrial isoform X1 [Amborella trichopoda]XP_020530485.1 folate synthesis bifunctional protein, mitochondrial isoform X1 [Amborella trichopoda]|eukprot:XP_006856417.2 folate synthesis bifunctional protein, mitochondrial isoform X1 [Amborella trichopoda]